MLPDIPVTELENDTVSADAGPASTVTDKPAVKSKHDRSAIGSCLRLFVFCEMFEVARLMACHPSLLGRCRDRNTEVRVRLFWRGNYETAPL